MNRSVLAWLCLLSVMLAAQNPQPQVADGHPELAGFLDVEAEQAASVPRVELPKTVIDLDKEFDGGSGIALKELSEVQISNLAMLGKVWGFLKYHHPLVTGGKRHWDYELFRILPRVLAAVDANAARSVVNQWIASLGTVLPCGSCASLVETDLQLRPPVTWLTDNQLGAELGETLRGVYRNRSVEPQQFYVSLAPGVRNPSFDHESGRRDDRREPDSGPRASRPDRRSRVHRAPAQRRQTQRGVGDAGLHPRIESHRARVRNTRDSRARVGTRRGWTLHLAAPSSPPSRRPLVMKEAYVGAGQLGAVHS